MAEYGEAAGWTEREVADPKGNWVSKRIVLGGDHVGLSFHETTIKAGSVNNFHYANHVEAVWLVEGEGTLTDLETGTVTVPPHLSIARHLIERWFGAELPSQPGDQW